MQARNNPPLFPLPHMSEWGEDAEYGLWMVLDFKGVRQTFRWIEPGKFMMGSPEDEAGRDDNEEQQEISLPGFWLADTAVTQALYEAVIKSNPSDFKGAQRPVESLSWDDAQIFISNLSDAFQGFNLHLPYEAQWEYACRAGTTTPFSFGETISTEEANYDGHFPYEDGKEGEDRGETIEVKALPANQWGLYQMHGNVWEWCEDSWQGQAVYPPDDKTLKSSTGDYRVLRGGSWIDHGQDLRSACRFHGGPSIRYHYAGFRLALGPELKPDRAKTA